MYQKIIKRMIDLILSIVGLIILSPLFLLLCIWIKFDSKGPILFKQKRIGKNKRYFNILKFRTMYIDTPKDMPTHMLSNHDQCITKSGKFLRKTSLDELPQIINIIKGEMSIIGPRPALWNQDDLISERDKYLANNIRPGLTGWAQINGRDELEIDIKAKLDGEYRESLSFFFDLKCFILTIYAVFKCYGIVEGKSDGIEKSKVEKIVIITNHSYMLWQFRRELIEQLLKITKVVLIMPFFGHENDFKELGCKCINIKIDRRGVNLFTDFKLFQLLNKKLNTEQPDLVLTYSIKPNIYGGYICKKNKIPYCVNVQGLGSAFQNKRLASFVTIMYKKAVSSAKTVFFENSDNAFEFVNRGIISTDRVTILNGAGVNLNNFKKQSYPSENDGIHFLYLGRIMKEKGMDEFLNTAKKTKEKYKDEVHFDVVGFFEDEYKDVIEQLGRDGIIVYHGFQEDPKPFYDATHCLVLPSYHEGMSNVLLEASSTGRALITTNIPGCREAVENGKNGFLCEPRNTNDLVRCVEMFVSLSSDERKNMGIAGRKKMEREFDKQEVVKKNIMAILK